MKAIFKSLFATLALTAGSVSLSAQIPCGKVDLNEMNFVRQNFERNFYNSRIVTSKLNMDGTDLFLENSANLIARGPLPEQNDGALKFKGNDETTLRVAAFHPYFCYEADFRKVPDSGTAGVCFYANDGSSRLTITRTDGNVKAEKDGTVLCSIECEKSPDFSLRVQYTGSRFHIFILEPGKPCRPSASVSCDMRQLDTPVKWSWGVIAGDCDGALLTRAESSLSCGTGQADPQIIQNSDGTPLVKDGRLYLCMTTRGFETIPDSYQGVYSLGLVGYDLKLEGALFFTEGDGRMLGYHATKIVREADRYLIITTTHGGEKHTLAWSETGADILHGIHYLECQELDFPHNDKAGKEFASEDPDFFYDAGAQSWRLAYCSLQSSDGGGGHLSYVTHLCESDSWNGPYTLLATSSRDNNTGIRITTVGGRRYVLSGGSGTTFYIYDYPSLDYIGTFNHEFPNGGFRGWPTIVPVRCGNYERYLWITFDRGAQTGRYSYGTLYFYLGDKMWKIE